MMFIQFLLILPKLYEVICDISKKLRAHNESVALDQLNNAKSVVEKEDAIKNLSSNTQFNQHELCANCYRSKA